MDIIFYNDCLGNNSGYLVFESADIREETSQHGKTLERTVCFFSESTCLEFLENQRLFSLVSLPSGQKRVEMQCQLRN